MKLFSLTEPVPTTADYQPPKLISALGHKAAKSFIYMQTLHFFKKKKKAKCLISRVHKNESMQRLISSLWGTGTAKFQVTWLLRFVQKGVLSFCKFSVQFYFRYFQWSMVLPKLKIHLNEKNTVLDPNGIHGHPNLNETERSVIAHYRNFNAPKICKTTVSVWQCCAVDRWVMAGAYRWKT